MHIHILGICGTFMGSLALLARDLGHKVTGSDTGVYPPMSTQLEAQGIELMEGYDPSHLKPAPDLVVVGNAMARGNPAVEYMLNTGLPYVSGPEWLRRHVLQGRWVVGVAGTHGKTTTSSMVAWILEHAGLCPGFLIGGIPSNFGISARLGGKEGVAEPTFFVVEADEYDSAFFDKRSKFIHYQPRTAILNNLEFDHADIFDDLAAIQRQFHHLVRTIPGQGRIILPASDENLKEVLKKGCWTPVEEFGAGASAGWQAELLEPGGSHFAVYLSGERQGEVRWSMTGMHSVNNALAALAAARHCGVLPSDGIRALCEFEGARRRMELVGEVQGVRVFDDFAHHPTAIATTLEGLRGNVGDARIFAVIEPRSNTMRMGVHQSLLAPSTAAADQVIWYQPPGLNWQLDGVIAASPVPARVEQSIEAIIADIVREARSGDQVVIMSNGGFGGIHAKLVAALRERETQAALATS
ncbi:UDP-N-acetylmuramate:L-alanyl-gamma-D-glutamyl-meso-diaminopimelate ligase (Murein peptide ligase) [gamma proteobacterium HdN1]|nr:UDP-N-acetylmuramate:L-alanyl-gamma-D-glutamyl-meso-diaminopimelate ligase (Murein peptide ligase) [gamma proteobacterium HdN1]